MPTFPGFVRRRGLRLLIAVPAVWLLVSFCVAYGLTRRPRPWFAEPVPTVGWGTLEARRIRTSDGHELGAWFARGRDGAPSVLVLHGNRGSRRNVLDRAELFASAGCSVLLVSLRAHGDSTGDFNDIGLSARHDVVAAVGLLEQLRPGRPVVIHGTSMGAAAALFAAEELARRVDGYILECPYQDLKTAVRNRTRNSLPPVLDWLAYESLVLVAPAVLPELAQTSAVRAAAAVPADVPVLVLAGGLDRRARPDEASAIFAQVRSHATLAVFERADHLRLHVADPARYRRTILGFIAALSLPERP
ncbi:MAG: alpha/beta fold hydrolase [Isosphaeraceae bacterium]|nr:alpha/beta fold hydrolase [Isosphaeraceae bacterium]